MALITAVSCPVSASGSPAAGSSRRMSRGLPATARATSTRRRWPADSELTFADGGAPRPTKSIAASTSARRAGPRKGEVIIATLS